MHKSKKKRRTPLVFPDGLSAEQLQMLQERTFMLDIIVPLDQRPKLAYIISCFNCQQKTTFEVDGRQPLTLDQLHLALILKGWIIAGRGYECPECMNHWTKGVVAYIEGNKPRIDARNTVESEQNEERSTTNGTLDD